MHLENVDSSDAFTYDNDQATLKGKKDDENNHKDIRTESKVSSTISQGSLPATIVGTIKQEKNSDNFESKSSQPNRRSRTIGSSSIIIGANSYEMGDNTNESKPLINSYEMVEEALDTTGPLAPMRRTGRFGV